VKFVAVFMLFCHEFPGAAKPQPKAIGNATEILLPRIPRIHTKIGEIRGQVFSVFSVQNSVAKNLCFCEKDLTVSSTNGLLAIES
jgi:hypothetical protein